MNSDPVNDSETVRDLPSAFKLPSYDRSYNSRVVLNFPVTRDPVYALALSVDGKLLAVGNDAGRLEVSFPHQLMYSSARYLPLD
jgi:hypothetical protein